MSQLSTATRSDLDQWMSAALDAGAASECFEELAQQICGRLYAQFEQSIVLARCYVTVPMAGLPERNATWVRGLAEAKGVASELYDTTPVISLVGTAGRNAAWNSRLESQGHVGIPMVSASFIDAIPMMSRLMASLGGNLSWIDSRDISHVVAQLGSVSGVFYVPQAATEVDSRQRKIIPASDFVAEHGVQTVFGTGGAFSSGQIFALLVFCSEQVPLDVARGFQQPMLRFKTSAAPFLRKVFVDGVTLAGAAQPASNAPKTSQPRLSELPQDPSARAEYLLGLLATRERELHDLNRLYLRLESELEDRTRSLRTILNTTSDGLFVADLDGTIYGETTAAIERWFGPRPERVKVWEYLFDESAKERSSFEVGFSQLTDDFIPFEVAAEQMPQRFRREGRIYSLRYEPVMRAERMERVLVVVRDVTAELEAASAERRARELQTMMSNLIRDRRGFIRFVEEMQSLLEQLAGPIDEISERRHLHTIRGNVALYGFQTFSDLAYRVESELVENQRRLGPETLALLRDSWRIELSTLAEMAEIELSPAIEISTSEHEQLLERLRQISADAPLLAVVKRWRYEPIKTTLNRLANQASRIAQRLGKQLEVRVEDRDLRLPLDRTQPIWSALVHVVRNAVDHGIEDPERRRALGKPACGLVTLSSSVLNDAWQIVVADDGAGIDWDSVRRTAQAAHIPCETDAELTEALFKDGFTTRNQASEISGRGVGLSALRAACRALGAEVKVRSTPNLGTVISVSLPLELIDEVA